MKILFASTYSDVTKDAWFASYWYDEQNALSKNYVDIKGIVDEKGFLWLDDLEKSFALLAARFSALTKWFWVAPMSRLDARPWGQEYIVKPLMFSRALCEWLDCNPNVSEVTLVGAPPLVGYLLEEFIPGVVIQGKKKFSYSLFFGGLMFKQGLKAKMMAADRLWFVLCAHAFRTLKPVSAKAIVLFELVHVDAPARGYQYFYGSLFETEEIQRDIVYGCVSHQRVSDSARKDCDLEKPGLTFLLLDYVGAWKTFVSFWINALIIFFTGVISLSKISCSVAGRNSFRFWPVYLLSELGRLGCFVNICSYFALKNVLRHGHCPRVIYPYEEKGIERAFLFACHEHNVKTIGYLPHPQHRLTVALRDGIIPTPAHPDQYAVCGAMYVDYLAGWAKKDLARIHVWGSGKSFERLVPSGVTDRLFRVLLFISHPNELRVFASWLKTDRRLTEDVFYSLRIYKACLDEQFALELKSLLRDFPCVEESSKEMKEDLTRCQLSAFCATSAGILAVKSGAAAVHLCLDDFFAINPCFDHFKEIQSCSNAKDFGDYLTRTRSLSPTQVHELKMRQNSFTEKVWCSPQRKVIQEDLFFLKEI